MDDPEIKRPELGFGKKIYDSVLGVVEYLRVACVQKDELLVIQLPKTLDSCKVTQFVLSLHNQVPEEFHKRIVVLGGDVELTVVPAGQTPEAQVSAQMENKVKEISDEDIKELLASIKA